MGCFVRLCKLKVYSLKRKNLQVAFFVGDQFIFSIVFDLLAIFLFHLRVVRFRRDPVARESPTIASVCDRRAFVTTLNTPLVTVFVPRVPWCIRVRLKLEEHEKKQDRQ